MDYADSNRNHFSADVISGALEQARTDDVTPPTVVLTSPVSGTESSGTVSITADATDNVLNFADSFYPAGAHTF